jgi:hypothetical protein
MLITTLLAAGVLILSLVAVASETWGMAFLFSHLGILNSPSGGWGVFTMGLIIVSEKILVITLVWIGIRHLLPVVLRGEMRENTVREEAPRRGPRASS